MAAFDVPLMGDEKKYFSIASEFTNIFTSLLHAQVPTAESLSAVYAGGIWPPFHPFLLGSVLFIFGKHIAAARLAMVLISAMTTPLVYNLTSKVSTKKAALLAAVIHILYPGFIAYSHYLWSETTYIFLLLLSVFFTIKVADEHDDRKRLIYAGAAGLCLGLSALTRSAAAPFLVILPLWLVLSLKGTRSRIFLPFVVLFTCFIIILPWQTAITMKAKKIGFLTTVTGKYMYMGNNPWYTTNVSDDSLFSRRKHDLLMENAIKEYAKVNLVGKDEAARMLALHEIKRDFRQFIVRCFYRLRVLWSSDFFLPRHLFRLVYPPMSHSSALFIWIMIVTSYFMFSVFAVFGLLGQRTPLARKSLFLCMVIIGMLPPIITVSNPRMSLPLIALMLPAAGCGAAQLESKISIKRGLLLLVIIMLFFINIISTLRVVGNESLPSSYYSELFYRIDSVLGFKMASYFSDRIIFRVEDKNKSDRLQITIVSKGYLFDDNESQEYLWEIPSDKRELPLNIYSHNTMLPLELLLSNGVSGQTSVIHPVRKHLWRQWQPTGIDGIEYMWSPELPQNKMERALTQCKF